jgi:hypothetical protein
MDTTSNSREQPEKVFALLDETFSVSSFPNLYRMWQISPENAEVQLRSIANAWHEGSITAAAIALESDLAHG